MRHRIIALHTHTHVNVWTAPSGARSAFDTLHHDNNNNIIHCQQTHLLVFTIRGRKNAQTADMILRRWPPTANNTRNSYTFAIAAHNNKLPPLTNEMDAPIFSSSTHASLSRPSAHDDNHLDNLLNTCMHRTTNLCAVRLLPYEHRYARSRPQPKRTCPLPALVANQLHRPHPLQPKTSHICRQTSGLIAFQYEHSQCVCVLAHET